jgi:hypothetical protein
MEVHHHGHTADPDMHRDRKKWTHYLWEFLMLFLAVFCGFLAENQREHLVEHQREKQYMRSMMEDLMLDTAEFNLRLINIDKEVPVFQAATELLYNQQFSDTIIRRMYNTVPQCAHFFSLSVQDRTMNQLKNSGNLRLIRNKTITDSLAIYWKGLDLLNNIILPGYDLSRIEVKNISCSLFNFDYYKDNTPFSGAISDNVSPKLLSGDKREFIKLANFISNLRFIMIVGLKIRITNQNKLAAELIDLIKKEYHLE